MSSLPFIKWYTSDFLTGIATGNLLADEIGVYAVILTLIADKGGPIEHDSAWIARRAGSSTRRVNQILAKLTSGDKPKLSIRDGLIGNRRMLTEISKRDGKSEQARDASWKRWHGDESELPFDAGSPDYLGNKPGYSQEQSDLKSGKKPHKQRKSAISDDADASRLARAPDSRVQSLEEESQRTANPTRVASPSADEPVFDLLATMNRLAQLGGVAISSPGRIASNLDIVKEWLALGYDLDGLVIPTIEEQRRDTREKTIGSLAFYSARLAKRFADLPAPSRKATPDERRAYLAKSIPFFRKIGRTAEADDMQSELAAMDGEDAKDAA